MIINTLNGADNRFSCDFEDKGENAQWTLNAGERGALVPNKWRIGDKMGFAGNSKGLYVSCLPDTTKMFYVGDTSCRTLAWRKISLAAGSYTLAYNWICNTPNEGIYVGYTEDMSILQEMYANRDAGTSLVLPKPLESVTFNNQTITWQNKQTNIVVNQNEGYLYVVWCNRIVDPYLLSGAIDNIEIYQGACPPPSNPVFDKETKTLSWTGAEGYTFDVTIYNSFTHKSESHNGLTVNSLRVDNLSEEGLYYFYVRSVNAEEDIHSVWVYAEQFIWLKGLRCIEFFDMTPDNSGVAKCYSTDASSDSNTCNNNYENCIHNYAGQIDYGFDNPLSVHTIHYRQDEVDPRTNGQLRTIPVGELASIRINGHWEKAGYHAACVEYEYPVVRGMSDVLVLKYAAVLEVPQNHDEKEQPRLKFQVLKGNQIVDPCSQGDFRAGYGDTRNWHHIKHQGSNNDSIVWCDWTTIKVSLRDYVGSVLTIRLSAYDCEPAGHFGYGYFSLNCESGDIKAINCGDFSTDHFDAPEGFNYRWYKLEDPTKILSTEQRFNISVTDTCVYIVDVIDKEHEDCFYSLEADPNPHFPHAEFSSESQPANCQNMVVFKNLSREVRINRLNGERRWLETPLTTARWSFGDGSEVVVMNDSVFTHEFPQVGGRFRVKCEVEMEDGLCVDSFVQEIDLPNIIEQVDTLFETCCDDSLRDSKGRMHYATDEQTFVDTVEHSLNKYGCDAYKIIVYKFARRYNIIYRDTICRYDSYFWEGDSNYYDSTVNISRHFLTADGCDSVLELHLYAHPRLEVNMEDMLEVCIDKPYLYIPYRVISGDLDSINVHIPYSLAPFNFEQKVYRFAKDEAIRITLPMTMLADVYSVNVEFKNKICGLEPRPFRFVVLYSSNIVRQKDGFMYVKNEHYNGGEYVFEEFQWYRNGIAIEGAKESYIPVENNDVDTVFTVLLRRKNEDRAIFSCPIVYNAGDDWRSQIRQKTLIAPNKTNVGGQVRVLVEDGFVVYAIDGKKIKRYEAGEAESFFAPLATGLYLLRFDNNETAKLIVY